jgi:hypothetical protein
VLEDDQVRVYEMMKYCRLSDNIRRSAGTHVLRASHVFKEPRG